MLSGMKALGFWGWVTLIIVWAIVGALVSRVFAKNSLDAAIAGNIAGLVAAIAYLLWWRSRYNRNFAKPS
jgi:uncharacterized MnhB-related membrane protein